MKYPTSVTIGGYTYRIEYVNTPVEVDNDFESDKNWLGQCTSDVIRVLATQEPFGILDTLVHEILHAIFSRNPMLRAVVQSEDMEEPFVNTLAAQLALLLVQNGWTIPEEAPVITKRILQEPK